MVAIVFSAIAAGCGPDQHAATPPWDGYTVIAKDPERRAHARQIIDDYLERQRVPPAFSTVHLDWTPTDPDHPTGQYHHGETIEVLEDISLRRLTTILIHELTHAADYALARHLNYTDTHASKTWRREDGSQVDIEDTANALKGGLLGTLLYSHLQSKDCGQSANFNLPLERLTDQAFNLPSPTITRASSWHPHTTVAGVPPTTDVRPLQANAAALTFEANVAPAPYFVWITGSRFEDASVEMPSDTRHLVRGWLMVDLTGQRETFYYSSVGRWSEAWGDAVPGPTTAPFDNAWDERARYLLSPYLLHAMTDEDGSTYGVLYDGWDADDWMRRWVVVRFDHDLSNVHIYGERCSSREPSDGSIRPASEVPPRLFETPDGIWVAWQVDGGLAFNPLSGAALDLPPRHWQFDQDALRAAYSDILLNDFLAKPFVVPLEELEASGLPQSAGASRGNLGVRESL